MHADVIDTTELTKKYLRESRVMQLATIRGDSPWVCSVYFVVDKNLKLYWLSYPSRRHSEDIHDHGAVAVAVVVQHAPPVIGLQAEGDAKRVDDFSTLARILPLYIKKYGLGKDLLGRIKSGTNKHALYEFTPRSMVLFDEENLAPDITHQIRLPNYSRFSAA